MYASKRCSSKSDHLLCLPYSASLGSRLSLLKTGSPSLLSSSVSPLDGSTFSDARAPTSIRHLDPRRRSIAVSLFELCRIAHLDGPHAPAREGSTDIFPPTATLPRLEYYILYCCCPFNNLLLRLQRCFMYLGIYSSVVIDVQCFGINRYVKVPHSFFLGSLPYTRFVTPRSPIRAIPQSGPPIREWELLYNSGPRFLYQGPGFPITRYFGIRAKGAKFPPIY
jgi:hypothetical protein